MKTYGDGGGFTQLASWFVWVKRPRRIPDEREFLAAKAAPGPVMWTAAPGEALSLGVSGS